MTVKEIIDQLGLQCLNEANLDAEVTGAYASDLLSDVMGNARSGQVWITMQTHKNVSAIAALKDIPAVIIVRGGVPDKAFLDRFEKEEGYRLLLCHHPEMYRDYVSGRDIDLTLCGHAHGGQIQIAGHGLYAPGQGFFPKLTHGLYDNGKMLLSRGMTNGAKPRVPRIGNPCELIILNITPA